MLILQPNGIEDIVILVAKQWHCNPRKLQFAAICSYERSIAHSSLVRRRLRAATTPVRRKRELKRDRGVLSYNCTVSKQRPRVAARKRARRGVRGTGLPLVAATGKHDGRVCEGPPGIPEECVLHAAIAHAATAPEGTGERTQMLVLVRLFRLQGGVKEISKPNVRSLITTRRIN